MIQSLSEYEMFPVIVKLKERYFVPPGTHVSQWAGDCIFLGECENIHALNKARKIEAVLSIEITKRTGL